MFFSTVVLPEPELPATSRLRATSSTVVPTGSPYIVFPRRIAPPRFVAIERNGSGLNCCDRSNGERTWQSFAAARGLRTLIALTTTGATP
jgi:hypothetical protein